MSYESWLYSLSDEDLRNMPARVQQDLIEYNAHYEQQAEVYMFDWDEHDCEIGVGVTGLYYYS